MRTSLRATVSHLAFALPLFCLHGQALAALSDYRMLSWNLEGSASDLSWTGVKSLLSCSKQPQKPAVIALQAVGEVPKEADFLSEQLIYKGIRRFPVKEYRWNIGTAQEPQYTYIYHINNWPNGGQLNLAMVTELRAKSVALIPPQLLATGMSLAERPLLGVQMDDETRVFTLHAAPYTEPASNEVDNVVSAATMESSQWAILGTFNRTPQQINILPHLGLYQVNERQGFDFMLNNQKDEIWIGKACRADISSDHAPISFSL